MSTSRSRAVLAAFAAFAALAGLAGVAAARPASAQAPAAAPAPPADTTLLLGARLLAGPRAEELGRLPGEGWEQRPVRRADGTVAVGACVVDPAAQEWLAPAGDHLRLVHRTRGPRWQRP